MRLRYPLSWLVLAASLALTGLSAYWMHLAERSEAATRFEQMVNGRMAAFDNRLLEFESTLRGIGALIAASPRVSAADWSAYAASLNQRGARDLVRAVGYAPLVADRDLDGFLAEARRARPEFGTALRRGARERALPVLFVLPDGGIDGAAAGDDLLASPAFAEAVASAERSARPEFSRAVDVRGRPAVMLLLPLRNSRGVAGHAFLLFAADALVADLARQDTAPIGVRITDESAGGASVAQAGQHAAPALRSVRSYDAGSRRWYLRFDSGPALERQLAGGMTGAIAVFGALGSFLLFGLVRVLSGTRRRAEEIAQRTTRALSDQMKLTEDLIERNPMPIFRKGADGRFVQFNRAWERLTGRARADWIGKTVAELPDLAEAERVALADRDFSGHPDHVERIETTLRTADGDACHVIVNMAALRLADGTIAGTIGTITDVTETRRLIEQNELQREQLALVNQSAQAGVWDIEWPDGRAYFSPRYFEMLGYQPTPDNMLPGARSELVHPDDRARVEAAREAHFNGAAPYFDCEYRLRRADGGYLWVNGRGLASLDGAGRPVRFTGSIIDITQRRLAQIEIERQRELLALVIESVQAGVWDEDLAAGTVYFSPRYRDILGFGPDEDLRDHAHDDSCYHAEDRAAVLAARTTALRDGTPLDLEFRMRRADGEYVWVNARAKASYGADGVPVRYTGAIIDIGRRKEAEFALRDANQRALEAAQVKSTFLATMSHEIRTPLNGVIGSAGLLQDTPLNAEQQDYVETIRISGVQLLTLIDDILDYSKIESGRMELEDEPFDVATVIEDAFDLVAERARAKRLELLYDIAPEVPRRIHGDITRVRQVLINLVGNAVKFTERGEICVSCAMAEGDPAGGGPLRLRFAVRDTGIGIDPDKTERLFNPFTQVDASTTRKYGGTGLGLAISQRLIGLMGGVIGVASTPGEGSTFTFTIATRRAEDGAAHSRRMREIGSIAGKRVLIVDDYPSNRRILAAQCANWGLWTVETASAKEALEAIEAAHAAETPFDAVITDMLMPEADGLDLAREVAAHRKAHRVRLPVLILSSAPRAEAFAGRDVHERWIEAYILKPARQAQLFNALLDALAPERPFHLAGPESVARPGAMQAYSGKLRILLAEDNEINRKIAVRMLERLGKTATVAENGMQALELATAGEFDCILMDVQMPELDGLEATRRIVAALPPERLPYIVAMTANAMAGDREICLAAGMHDYIAKPVQTQALADALARCQQFLQRREGGGRAEAPAAAGAGGGAAATGAAAAPDALPVIDTAQIEELLGLDDSGAVLADFVQMYTTQAPQRIDEITRAFAEGDLKRLTQVAHSLKGASGNLGALAVADAARRLEVAGQSGDDHGIAALIDEMRARYRDAEAALKALPGTTVTSG
ncbi:MAG: PAS domain-containing protein [Burkholderiales bacterium]|nr:PAS domain-containing protein [Burkholderiales bacterium]